MSLLATGTTWHNTASSLVGDARRSAAAYVHAQQTAMQNTTKTKTLDFGALSIERICCDRHFGGMPIEDVIAIVRKHAPEYFV